MKNIIKVLIYIIGIILTIISFIFIWKINKSIKILIELFKTNDYETFFKEYFKNIYTSVFELLGYFLIILLFLIVVPFVWKWNKTFKIFIELYKTKEYKKFFNDYFSHLIDCLFSILNFLLSILIIL